MADFGAWSLLPPALAIVFAMLTRRVYQSLALGVFTAGIMVAGAASMERGVSGILVPFAATAGGFIQGIQWIVEGIADTGHAAVIAFTLFLGGLVALFQRSGAIRGFGEAALRIAATKRRGQTLAWAVGAMFLAIDDYFHVISAGAIFRPMTDRLQVSREKLSYIIDSTAAPMVILIPISTWAGYILGVVGTTYGDGFHVSPFETFLRGIPFNFYALMTVAFVGVIALSRIEFGPMRTAERRAARGEVLRPGSQPLVSREIADMEPVEGAKPRAYNLVLPVLFLFAAAVAMLYVTGASPGGTFYRALQNAQAEMALAIASFLTLLFAMVLYGLQGTLKQDDFLDTVLTGFKSMVPVLAILGLAWGIGNAVAPVAAGGVGLGDWLVSAIGEDLAVESIPFFAFLISAVVAFATGTSFGTFAIMVPVTLGLAMGQGADANTLGAALAATLGGAVFGDHCSPISDTTVMSSMAGHCDHIDHVRTQMPYALTVATVAAAGYGVYALTRSAAMAWAANLVLFVAVFFVAWLASRGADRRERRAEVQA